MKSSEIQKGKRYTAKVSGKLTTVRVDEIRERTTWSGKWSTVYDVTNLSTGRKTTFRSAARFRRESLGAALMNEVNRRFATNGRTIGEVFGGSDMMTAAH